MGYRNVFLENPGVLSIHNSQLLIQTTEEYTFPLDDLQSILIDNGRSVVSMAVLTQLSKHNIAVLITDELHLPATVLLPIQGYYHKLTTLNQQISVTRKFKDRLWQKNIRSKILNQGRVLKLLGLPGVPEMTSFAKGVIEGDKTHQEGYAAGFYFKNAFGPDFVRRKAEVVNAALNYGYAIIRSCVARELCAFGFEPALGVFHHNQLNPFNLADDFMESYRPIVDLLVLQMNFNNSDILDHSIKTQLLNIQSYNVQFQDQVQTVRNAIHLSIESISVAFSTGKVSGVIFPQVIPLEPHGVS